MQLFRAAVKGARQAGAWTILWCSICLLVPGCPSTTGGSSNGNGNGNDNTGGVDTSGDPVDAENAAEFADAIDQTLATAIDEILADPALLGGKHVGAKSTTGVRLASIGGGADSFAGVNIGGLRGSARANGTRVAAFWPPRFEITLDLDGYETTAGLTLTGTVEYNFVRDDRANPPVDYGLQSGSITYSGRFGGQASIHTFINGADRSTTITTTAGAVHRIGALEPPGFITYVSTIAGTGEFGLRNGPAAQAMFDAPTGIAVDEDGRVYVADRDNNAIREIDLDGTVSTVVEMEQPYDIEFDSKGLLVVGKTLPSHGHDDHPLVRLVVRGDARGTVIPIVTGTDTYPGSPFPLCAISQSCDGRAPVGTLHWGLGIDVRNQGVLVAQWALPPLLRLVLPDGFVLTISDAVNTGGCAGSAPGAPRDLVHGNNGEIYFSTDCHAILVLETDGTVRTLAGRLHFDLGFADGVGDEARFSYPAGLAFDGERYLYVADSSNSAIRRVDIETGEVIRLAGCRSNLPGFECNSSTGLRDGPGDYALFDGPNGIALDRWGDLYLADDRNHTIRLIRIIADPLRAPSVHRFDPAVMQQGDEGTLTITGRNLGTVQSVDLGEGVTATVENVGYQRATASVTVASNATPGPRRVTVTTAFGTITTPEDLSFTVLADTRGGIQVETIAGTGSAALDSLNYGSAQSTTFAFPGGMHAISADRLLVADPIEQRIRLLATRVGAVEEFFQLLTYAATGSDVDVLGTITGVFDSIQTTLDFLGLSSGLVDQTEDAIRNIAEQSVDAICDTIGVEDCEWLSLPWAGSPYVPGSDDGFRLNSTFFLPTDIWAVPGAANSRFYVADSGNAMVRVIGYDIEQQQAAPMQVFRTDDQPDYLFAVTPLGNSVYASMPGSLAVTELNLNSGAVNADWAAIPRGIPLGMASYDGSSPTDDRTIYVADPLNATVFRVINNGGVSELKNIRGDVPSFVIGECVDGPATFATWGAPMDVAVTQTGTVYVADAGCNSIRVIKDAGFGQDTDGLVGSLREFVASHQSRISAAAAQRIEENLRVLDTEFLDANRFTVTTLAGSPDGKPGFADGPAAIARFNSPTSIAVASTGDSTIVFVADTGNRRIRRIIIP